MTDLAPVAPCAPQELKRFLGRIKNGADVNLAAGELGWSQLKMRKVLENPDIQEAIDWIKSQRVESVERMAFKLANKGNVEMIKMVLFCQAPERGWKPPAQRHEVAKTGKVHIDIAASVRHAVAQMVTAGELTPAEVDADIVDAEIVDEDS